MQAKILAINKTAYNEARAWVWSSCSRADKSFITSDWGGVLDDDIWPLALPQIQNH